MISKEEAKSLIDTLLTLRATAPGSRKLKQHENLCVEKFAYLVNMHSASYKSFTNYEDLKQEGFEALAKGLLSYKDGVGDIFWWLHHYISTKVSRKANLFTAIRFPLKKAKEIAPKREALPMHMTDEFNRPDILAERNDLARCIVKSIKLLPEQQQYIVSSFFGLDGDAKTIEEISKDRGIPKKVCIACLKSGKKNINKYLRRKKLI
jgi:DNA-directed RNA polymerase specialized sigma subunit